MVSLLAHALLKVPFLNKEGEACGFCGASPDEKCKKEEVETNSLPEVGKTQV